jgi:hypothetical protein
MHTTNYPEYTSLRAAWIWANRTRSFRVHFADGDEYVMTDVFAAQDIGDPPHATGHVSEVIRRVGKGPLDPKADMFFYLSELAEVSETSTGEILFRSPPNEELKPTAAPSNLVE